MNNLIKFSKFLNEETVSIFNNNSINENIINNIENIKNLILDDPYIYVYKDKDKYIEICTNDYEFTYIIDLIKNQIKINDKIEQYNEKDIDELHEFILLNCKNIEDNEEIQKSETDIDDNDIDEKIIYNENNNKNMINNVLKFDSFINEAKMSKENKVIKEIIDLIEENKDIKISYKENKNPKFFVDIEFKFIINEDKYVVNKQKTKSNQTIILITKNGDKILSETVNSKSLLSMITKLDTILITLYRKKEKITEELNTDDNEFNDAEKVFDDDQETEIEKNDININDEDEDNYTENIEKVKKIIRNLRNCGIDNIIIKSENFVDVDTEENHFEFEINNVKYMFEFNDQNLYVEKDDVEVLNIENNSNDNITEQIETLKEEIIDIFNEKSKEINEEIEEESVDNNYDKHDISESDVLDDLKFEAKRLKSYKGFKYITDDKDDRINGYEYKITSED